MTNEVTGRVKFVYAVNDSNRRVTVAYQYDDANQCIRAAKAECSKRDRFEKRIGREVSFGRLAYHGGTVVPFSSLGGTSYKDVAAWVAINMARFVKQPVDKLFRLYTREE